MGIFVAFKVAKLSVIRKIVFSVETVYCIRLYNCNVFVIWSWARVRCKNEAYYKRGHPSLYHSCLWMWYILKLSPGEQSELQRFKHVLSISYGCVCLERCKRRGPLRSLTEKSLRTAPMMTTPQLNRYNFVHNHGCVDKCTPHLFLFLWFIHFVNIKDNLSILSFAPFYHLPIHHSPQSLFLCAVVIDCCSCSPLCLR